MNHFDNLRLLTRICKETPRVICADADLFLKVDDTEPAPQGVAFIKCIAQGRPVRGGGRVASGASDVRRQGRVASGGVRRQAVWRQAQSRLAGLMAGLIRSPSRAAPVCESTPILQMKKKHSPQALRPRGARSAGAGAGEGRLGCSCGVCPQDAGL